MDGNGRWAQQKLRPRTFGHIKGARVAKKIITECSRLKIKYLTLYAFSTENWLRPQEEVSFLMTLLYRYLNKETDNLVKENIRFKVIGDISRLPTRIQEAIDIAYTKTKNCSGLTVQFALNYGSRQEIIHAVNLYLSDRALGKTKSENMTESILESYLYTAHAPDPDLVIRTSGEERISNFLLWQSAYSELYFTKTLWPDFKVEDLTLALQDYNKRQRRFGKVEVSNQTPPAPITHLSVLNKTTTSDLILTKDKASR